MISLDYNASGYYLILIVLGLVVGSFLGMLTYRLPQGIGLGGRSFCDNCKKKISWSQNLPVVSYLFVKICSSCKSKISSRYVLIEAATATVFVLTGYAYDQSPELIEFVGSLYSHLGFFTLPYLLLIVTVLLALAIVDIEKQILPDSLVYFLGFLFFAYFLFFPGALFFHLFTGYLVFLFFLIIYLVTRGQGMGFGDVKLSFVAGSFLGFPLVFVWIFGAFTLGAVVGLILLAVKRAKLGVPIPFGPFLLINFWITIFYGEKIISWYTGL